MALHRWWKRDRNQESGIRNPLDGKRYNIGKDMFFLSVTTGPTYLSEHDERPITPGMVREYIEIAFLKTRQLPDFRMFYNGSGTCHVFTHKDMPYEEVLRRVTEKSYYVTTPMKDGDVRIWGGENPNPARHALTTHVMYFFEHKHELSEAAKKRSAERFAEFKAKLGTEAEPFVTPSDNVIYVKTNNEQSEENV